LPPTVICVRMISCISRSERMQWAHIGEVQKVSDVSGKDKPDEPTGHTPFPIRALTLM
jgi:hypothetical protein